MNETTIIVSPIFRTVFLKRIQSLICRYFKKGFNDEIRVNLVYCILYNTPSILIFVISSLCGNNHEFYNQSTWCADHIGRSLERWEQAHYMGSKHETLPRVSLVYILSRLVIYTVFIVHGFSARDAARRHFSRQAALPFRRKFGR
jgi:hypothetical protein